MKDINKIIERYYKGDTSEEEEKILFNLMSTIDDANIQIEKILIDFYQSEKQIKLSPEFEENLLKKISDKNVSILKSQKNNLLYWISGIAAIFTIVIGLFLIINNSNDNNKITLTEKDRLTIEHTINTLTMMSEYFNKADEQIEKLRLIDTSFETLQQATKIEEYNNFIDKLLGDES